MTRSAGSPPQFWSPFWPIWSRSAVPPRGEGRDSFLKPKPRSCRRIRAGTRLRGALLPSSFSPEVRRCVFRCSDRGLCLRSQVDPRVPSANDKLNPESSGSPDGAETTRWGLQPEHRRHGRRQRHESRRGRGKVSVVPPVLGFGGCSTMRTSTPWWSAPRTTITRSLRWQCWTAGARCTAKAGHPTIFGGTNPRRQSEEHGLVTQTGNQIHSSTNYRRVVELIRSERSDPSTKSITGAGSVWDTQTLAQARTGSAGTELRPVGGSGRMGQV